MGSYISRPNEDVAAGWTENPVGTAYTCLDDNVLQPTAPDTADYITSSTDAQVCLVGFEPVIIPLGERVTEIILWVYGKTAGAAYGAALYDGTSGASISGASSFLVNSSYAWSSDTVFEGNLSSYQLDNLWGYFLSIGSSATYVAACYLEFVTESTSETIVLDPAEVSGGRTELDLSAGPIEVLADGIDWGDAAVESYMAEQLVGEVAVDRRWPNREISIPLKMEETYDVSFAASRGMLQQKVAQIQNEGRGWLKRITANGGTAYADLVGASLTLPGSWEQARRKRQSDGVLTLTALPDFYGDEIELSDHSETSATELTFLETDLKGDAPARVRIVVDEDQGQDQKALIWSFRSRNYSGAATAAVSYQAEALTAQDIAGTVVNSGASGSRTMAHGTLTTDWTPIASTYIAGTGHMTHEGTYRCYARAYSASGTTVQLRAVYDVGDLTNPTKNNAWRFPGGSAFYIADLGELQLVRSPLGVHRWMGQVQALGDAGGESVQLDKVWIVNTDDGMGVCRASSDNTDITFSSYAARDEFNQVGGGTITGKALPAGGTWSGTSGTTDFTLDSTNHVITRATTSETAYAGARMIRASSSSASTQRARVDFKRSALGTAGYLWQGVLLRWVDASNFVWAGVQASVGSVAGVFGSVFAVYKVKAGVSYLLDGYQGGTFFSQLNLYYRVSCTIDSTGRWAASLGSTSAPSLWSLSGQDADLATGATLATGTAGIMDMNTDTAASTRTYDNFAAAVPNLDAANFANQSAQLTTQGQYRLDQGGTAYGPMSIVTGDLPRLPPPGLENKPVEVFLKMSRGDMASIPDSGIDDLSAQVFYRPSWLFAARINADSLEDA